MMGKLRKWLDNISVSTIKEEEKVKQIALSETLCPIGSFLFLLHSEAQRLAIIPLLHSFICLLRLGAFFPLRSHPHSRIVTAT